MKVGVLHFNLNTFGGEQLVCFNAIQALKQNDHEIGLCTRNPLDYKSILDVLGVDVENHIDYFIFCKERRWNSLFKMGSLFKTYQFVPYLIDSYFCIKKLNTTFRSEVVLITQLAAIIPKEMINKTIIYVHCPLEFTLTNKWNTPNYVWKAYCSPINLILKNFDAYKDARLMANSKYIARIIEQLWNRKATVVYPPCPLYLDLPIDQKRNWICTIGRFSPEKRYDIVLEIARKLPDFQFHLVGSVSTNKWLFFSKLKHQIKSLKNVHIHLNATNELKLSILERSKILFHAMKGEHFGISLVEALSSGTIPVSHNSGAAKEDNVVPYEFRWDNIEEAIDILQKCIDGWNINLANILRKSSLKFGSKNFQNRFLKFIEN